MGFVQVLAGGAAVVAVVVMVGGGMKGCAMEESPEGVSITEKFTKHALKTGGDMARATGEWAKKQARDPENLKAVEEGAQTVTTFAGGVLERGVRGVAKGIEELSKKPSQVEVSPSGP